MGIQVEHELHRRRLGRNVGLALVLLVFVGLVFGLTLVKTKRGDFAMRPNATGELDPNYHPQPAQPQSGSSD